MLAYKPLWKAPLFAFISVAALSSECTLVETRQGTVEVLPVDFMGRPIRGGSIEWTPLNSNHSIRTANARTSLVYGDYRLRVELQGFRTAQQEIRVHQPEMAVRVQLTVGAIGCPSEPAEIGGRVLRHGNNEELWVKAIPIKGAIGSEARVGKRGHFLISGLEESTYVVLLLRGETVLHQQVVRTYSAELGASRDLKIDLREHK